MTGSLLQLLAIVRAVWVSVRERWWFGVAAGAARVMLFVAAVFAIVEGKGARFANVDARPSPAAAIAVIASAVLAPIVSSATLGLAYRRYAGVRAADEERLRRPFDAWLPVTLFDAVFVAINLFVLIDAR